MSNTLTGETKKKYGCSLEDSYFAPSRNQNSLSAGWLTPKVLRVYIAYKKSVFSVFGLVITFR